MPERRSVPPDAVPATTPAPAPVNRVAVIAGSMFWAGALGAIVLFGWLAVVGGLHPLDVVGMSAGVIVLITLSVVRSMALKRQGLKVSRHPDVLRQRQRRGYF